MRSLRFVLKNFRPVLFLTAQESAAFLILFGGLFLLMASAHADSYFAWKWDPAFFPHWLDLRPGAAAAVVPFVLLTAVAFLFTRLVLLGGTFGVLDSGWAGIVAFRRDAHRAFGRFLLLAILFAIPAALVWGGIAAGLDAAGRVVDDARWPYWILPLKGLALFLFLTPVAYLHAASRFRTLATGRLRLVHRFRLRPLLAFYGYSLPDLPIATAMGWIVMELLQGTTGWGVLPWIAAFQLAAIARNTLRLMAFRCALPMEPPTTAAGPLFQPGAEADPPELFEFDHRHADALPEEGSLKP